MHPPCCSYIDLLGFLWAMLLVSLAVFIFFTGAYMDHKHQGALFKKSQEEPAAVTLHQLSEKLLTDKVQEAIASGSMYTARPAGVV